jgi:GNAT superfamily N-acetyltransferase
LGHDDVHIRRAETTDHARLCALDARAEHTPASHVWVAESATRLVGYGVMSASFFGRSFVELIFVAADARRMGVGSALLGAIERAVSADRLFTSTNESNAAMRALLAKRGYVPSGRIEHLDEGDPELVFVKLLLREEGL